MCLKLKTVDVEKLRLHLLDKYGVSNISIGDADLRVAISCVVKNTVEELFDRLSGNYRSSLILGFKVPNGTLKAVS